MKKLLFVSLLSLSIVSLLPAYAGPRPIPPHVSGDGGRGLNAGARAESANGANTDRPANERY